VIASTLLNGKNTLSLSRQQMEESTVHSQQDKSSTKVVPQPLLKIAQILAQLALTHLTVMMD
jgi:hypothetical protein